MGWHPLAKTQICLRHLYLCEWNAYHSGREPLPVDNHRPQSAAAIGTLFRMLVINEQPDQSASCGVKAAERGPAPLDTEGGVARGSPAQRRPGSRRGGALPVSWSTPCTPIATGLQDRTATESGHRTGHSPRDSVLCRNTRGGWYHVIARSRHQPPEKPLKPVNASRDPSWHSAAGSHDWTPLSAAGGRRSREPPAPSRTWSRDPADTAVPQYWLTCRSGRPGGRCVGPRGPPSASRTTMVLIKLKCMRMDGLAGRALTDGGPRWVERQVATRWHQRRPGHLAGGAPTVIPSGAGAERRSRACYHAYFIAPTVHRVWR